MSVIILYAVLWLAFSACMAGLCQPIGFRHEGVMRKRWVRGIIIAGGPISAIIGLIAIVLMVVALCLIPLVEFITNSD